MKAIVLTGKECLELAEVAAPKMQHCEVRVVLKAAALNHRDLWIKKGQYAGIQYPSILGSDGCGEVVEVGAGVESSWLGKTVVFNPSFAWGSDSSAQGRDFSILGLPRQGTLAGEIVVPVSQLGEKPSSWTVEEAAALPLAGLTAYRALFTRAGLKRGERVLISGIGGGVAVYALQFAVAAGAEVWVTSSSQEKIRKAVALGAKGGFDYNQAGWTKSAAESVGNFPVIIDSAAGSGFDALLDVASPGARIAVYGATRGAVPELLMRKIFWKQISLLGSTMGSPEDWAGLMSFIKAHDVRPIVSSVHRFEDFTAAFEEMDRGSQFGKIVLRH